MTEKGLAWFRGRLIAVATFAAMSACAIPAAEQDARTYIFTDPLGARCDLMGRDGFRQVVQAPAAVTLPLTAAPVVVACDAPGHSTGAEILDADREGWVFGDVLLGGVPRQFLTSTTGLGSAYPVEVTVTLAPKGTKGNF